MVVNTKTNSSWPSIRGLAVSILVIAATSCFIFVKMMTGSGTTSTTTEASIDAILASLKTPPRDDTTIKSPTSPIHLAHHVSENLSTALMFHKRRGLAYLMDADGTAARQMHVILTRRFLHFTFHLSHFNSYAAIPIQKNVIKLTRRSMCELYEDLVITVNAGHEAEFQLIVRFMVQDEQSWFETLEDSLNSSIADPCNIASGVKSAQKLQYLTSSPPQNRPLLTRLRTSTIELFDQFFPSATSAPPNSFDFKGALESKDQNRANTKGNRLSGWFTLSRPRAETFGSPNDSRVDRYHK